MDLRSLTRCPVWITHYRWHWLPRPWWQHGRRWWWRWNWVQQWHRATMNGRPTDGVGISLLLLLLVGLAAHLPWTYGTWNSSRSGQSSGLHGERARSRWYRLTCVVIRVDEWWLLLLRWSALTRTRSWPVASSYCTGDTNVKRCGWRRRTTTTTDHKKARRHGERLLLCLVRQMRIYWWA